MHKARPAIAALIAGLLVPLLGPGETRAELDATLYCATSHTFIGSVFSLLGMHDVAHVACGPRR